MFWYKPPAINKTRIWFRYLTLDRIGLRIKSDRIGSDRTGIFAFGAELLF